MLEMAWVGGGVCRPERELEERRKLYICSITYMY